MRENISSRPSFQIDFKVYFFYLLRYWYFLVLGLGISCAYSFYTVRYSKATYTTSARMLVKDEHSSWGQEYFLPGMELVSGRNRLINEIGIIKSYPLMKRVADSLSWDVAYYKKGNINTSEFYPSHPFNVELLSGLAPKGIVYIKFISTGKFSISLETESLDSEVMLNLGESFKYKDSKLRISSNYLRPNDEEVYAFQFNNNGKNTRYLQRSLFLIQRT